jgi:GNAT superfamily N-acetyltransferase
MTRTTATPGLLAWRAPRSLTGRSQALREVVKSTPWLRRLAVTGAVRSLRRVLSAAYSRERLCFYRLDLTASALTTSAAPRRDAPARRDACASIEVASGGDVTRSSLLEHGAATADVLARRLALGDQAFSARVDGSVVSQAWLTRAAILVGELQLVLALAPGEAWTYDWFTVPAARGRGLARALVESIIESCARNGVRILWVAANDWNLPSRRLFERSGFAPVGELTYQRVLGASHRKSTLATGKPALRSAREAWPRAVFRS